jgi:hypothetical protein
VRPYRAFGRRLASSLGLLLFAALSPRVGGQLGTLATSLGLLHAEGMSPRLV